MATPYEMLGIGADASRADVEAAYRAQRDLYAAERHAHLPDDLQQLAAQRRSDLAAAYHTLRSAVAAPVKLDGIAERQRDRETMIALLALVVLAALVPLFRNVAVPTRSVAASGGEAAALTAQPAPNFSAATLDGSQISLDEYKGKVVLINFWATWCPPCVRETPRLTRLYESYREQGFVLLGVNTTYQDDRAKVEQFARDQQMTYPVVLDTDSTISGLYPARLMPSSYLIDRSGKIVSVKVGEIDEAQMQEQIEALLKQAP